MTIDRRELLPRPSNEQKAILEAYEHNLRLAGEANLPHPLSEFKARIGFMFATPNSPRVWRIIRKFKNDQVMVQTLDRQHTALWDENRPVKLPENLNEEGHII